MVFPLAPASMKIPLPALPMSSVPVQSVPMKLPCTRVPVPELWIRIPSPKLPAITFRSLGPTPPIVLFAPITSIPGVPLPSATVPVESSPIQFPATTLLSPWRWMPSAWNRLITKPRTVEFEA